MSDNPSSDHHLGDALAAGAVGDARPFLSVFFECCRVYTRVYRRPSQSFYVARCPKCLRATRVRIGPDGTEQRFFVAR